MGLISFFSEITDSIASWFHSRHRGKSKETRANRDRMLERLHPEIKNIYPHMIKEKQNNRRFTPKPKGMKQFLRNPSANEKDLNRLKSEIGNNRY